MARGVHFLAGIRKGLDRMTGDEPGTPDPVFLEQRDQPWRGNPWPELATRNPRSRRLAARDEARDAVEVEGEADDVPLAHEA